MYLDILKKVKRIYVVGDTHGPLPIELLTAKNSAIIHVGDYMVGQAQTLDEVLLKQTNAFLKENNSYLILNLGNWDDSSYWVDKEKQKYWNIYFAKTYEIIEIAALRFLFLGGAVSIDRKDTASRKHFKNTEYLTSPKAKDINDLSVFDVDFVISHTAPEGRYPTAESQLLKSYALRDHRLYSDISAERGSLFNFQKKFYQFHRERRYRWYYGHFHPKNVEESRAINIDFKCLPINFFEKVFEL